MRRMVMARRKKGSRKSSKKRGTSSRREINQAEMTKKEEEEKGEGALKVLLGGFFVAMGLPILLALMMVFIPLLGPLGPFAAFLVFFYIYYLFFKSKTGKAVLEDISRDIKKLMEYGKNVPQEGVDDIDYPVDTSLDNWDMWYLYTYPPGELMIRDLEDEIESLRREIEELRREVE